MKWIIYLVLSLTKLFIISVLMLLSIIVLPIIALILSLGIVLSFVRDNEPSFYQYRLPSLQSNNSVLAHIKEIRFILSPPQFVSRLQHIRIPRNKSRY